MREDLVASREEHRETLRAAGLPPYPSWRGRSHTAAAFHTEFDRLAQTGTPVTAAGRLRTMREHGAVRFLDLVDATGKMQLLCRSDDIGDKHFALLNALDPGDVITATGNAVATRTGEKSLQVTSWAILAKALRPPPEKRAGLRDEEERARHREVDLLVNEETRATFRLRALILRRLRELLIGEGFTEVETPILQHLPGGAAAQPFRTHHNALNLDLFLRIAPELFLKRLVIGGYEKVFELGRLFRNEGVDRSHNPEFTSCELYQAYATVEDLIPLTERLIATLLTEARGSARFSYQGKTLDFTPPWPRVHFVDAVEKATGVHVLREREPATYLRALERTGARLPEDHSLPNLMDELVTEAVRKKTAGPLLILGAPVELVPLAKRDPQNSQLVQRMQLIAAGMELVNAYTEENDPVDQERRLREHARLRRASGSASPRQESEIHPLDQEYIDALRVGLPPTAGWGLGVDRLVMLASDQPSIRDVQFFPLLRPKHD